MKKEQIEKYKENICPHCTHYNDANFEDCEICKCVDGTINQNVVIKLTTKNDNIHIHNSIISSWIMNDKSLKRFEKKSKNIYINDKK